MSLGAMARHHDLEAKRRSGDSVTPGSKQTTIFRPVFAFVRVTGVYCLFSRIRCSEEKVCARVQKKKIPTGSCF